MSLNLALVRVGEAVIAVSGGVLPLALPGLPAGAFATRLADRFGAPHCLN